MLRRVLGSPRGTRGEQPLHERRLAVARHDQTLGRARHRDVDAAHLIRLGLVRVRQEPQTGDGHDRILEPFARVKRHEADSVGASSRLVTRASRELHDRNTRTLEGRRDFLLDEPGVIDDGHVAPRVALPFQRHEEAAEVGSLLAQSGEA